MQDVCLFAHFDGGDKVDEYVLWYLRKIKEVHFSIIFISTARLSQTDVERLRVDCCDVILRENSGLDFGSWSAGFAKHSSGINGRLLLANDSVYGPIGNLPTALERVTRRPADIYGLVESIEFAPHLQSWFLLFEPWVVQHTEFKAILSQPFSGMTKTQIIANGEVSLSRRLVGVGFRYEALYSISRAGLVANRHAVNAMHLLWRELLFEEGVPFVKIDLLRSNPICVEDATTILRVLEPLDPQFCGLIKLHLARTASRELRHGRDDTPLGRRIRGYHTLLRNGYHLNRQKRRVAEVWNLIRIETLIVALRASRVLGVICGLMLRNRPSP
jgi:lipopolysaccharide biosynthesis protein